MANPQEKPVAAIRESSSSPLSSSETETHFNIEDYYEDDYQKVTYSSSSCCCCCFHGIWFRRNKSSSIGSKRSLLSNKQEDHQMKLEGNYNNKNWFMEKVKKAKEISAVIAGPKWKNFILGFNNKKRASKINQFHYDPQSYALNFDDGIVDKDFDELSYPDFSARLHATSALL